MTAVFLKLTVAPTRISSLLSPCPHRACMAKRRINCIEHPSAPVRGRAIVRKAVYVGGLTD